MLVRRLVGAVFGAMILLAGGWTAAGAQGPLGTGCARQAENDAQVRDLFGPLLGRFAAEVGRPVGCVADAPDGELAQQTTAGLLYVRPEGGGPVRIVVFTDGHRHWAVDANLSRVTLYWEGDAPYPPTQGVTRIPVSAEVAQAEAPWPPSPAPTVGRAAPAPASPNRPTTGEQIVEPTYGGGRGELTLVNELPVDVAFKLRDADGARATRAFVYVRAGERTKLDGLRVGTYELQGISGVDWDPEARRFRRGLSVFKANEPLDMPEVRTEEGITWITLTYTIYPVSGGGEGGLSPLDLKEFQEE